MFFFSQIMACCFFYPPNSPVPRSFANGNADADRGSFRLLIYCSFSQFAACYVGGAGGGTVPRGAWGGLGIGSLEERHGVVSGGELEIELA